ncbi:MAG: hypothetical protein EOP42_12420, partial [Sphingobacteriaceae bacterium]
MSKISFVLFCCLFYIGAYSQNPAKPIAIIPKPVTLKTMQGKFILPASVIIQAANTAEMKPVTDYLKAKL